MLRHLILVDIGKKTKKIMLFSLYDSGYLLNAMSKCLLRSSLEQVGHFKAPRYGFTVGSVENSSTALCWGCIHHHQGGSVLNTGSAYFKHCFFPLRFIIIDFTQLFRDMGLFKGIHVSPQWTLAPATCDIRHHLSIHASCLHYSSL